MEGPNSSVDLPHPLNHIQLFSLLKVCPTLENSIHISHALPEVLLSLFWGLGMESIALGIDVFYISYLIFITS